MQIFFPLNMWNLHETFIISKCTLFLCICVCLCESVCVLGGHDEHELPLKWKISQCKHVVWYTRSGMSLRLAWFILHPGTFFSPLQTFTDKQNTFRLPHIAASSPLLLVPFFYTFVSVLVFSGTLVVCVLSVPLRLLPVLLLRLLFCPHPPRFHKYSHLCSARFRCWILFSAWTEDLLFAISVCLQHPAFGSSPQ